VELKLPLGKLHEECDYGRGEESGHLVSKVDDSHRYAMVSLGITAFPLGVFCFRYLRVS